MGYELYYWATIQGRGEFVRLALEEAGAEYVDVARHPSGVAAMQRLMDGAVAAHPPFAPPFLKDGEVLIGQTANILLYLGRRHALAPREEAGRMWAHQLTIADVVDEAHDTHHPIASGLYYEDQQAEARRRAACAPARICAACSPIWCMAIGLCWSRLSNSAGRRRRASMRVSSSPNSTRQ
jgi:glutathione S-transferase